MMPIECEIENEIENEICYIIFIEHNSKFPYHIVRESGIIEKFAHDKIKITDRRYKKFIHETVKIS